MKKTIKYLSVCVLFPIFFLILGLKYYTYSFIKQDTAQTNQQKFIRPDTTEVFVLGVLHKSTEKVGYDDLYNLLENIKPNIILFERDSLAFDKDMNLKTKWWKVVIPKFLDKYRQSNLEEIAVKKYLYHNKFAFVRPYEWTLRDKFHQENQILTKPNEIFQRLDELAQTNKMTDDHKQILENFYTLTAQLESYGDSSLYEINTIRQDSLAEKRQNSQYHRIKNIIDSNENLKIYSAFYAINEQYWDIRNQAMAANIQTYIQNYPNSRIVVLNGYFHRYYLRQELINKQANLNFRLKDIER